MTLNRLTPQKASQKPLENSHLQRPPQAPIRRQTLLRTLDGVKANPHSMEIASSGR